MHYLVSEQVFAWNFNVDFRAFPYLLWLPRYSYLEADFSVSHCNSEILTQFFYHYVSNHNEMNMGTIDFNVGTKLAHWQRIQQILHHININYRYLRFDPEAVSRCESENFVLYEEQKFISLIHEMFCPKFCTQHDKGLDKIWCPYYVQPNPGNKKGGKQVIVKKNCSK